MSQVFTKNSQLITYNLLFFLKNVFVECESFNAILSLILNKFLLKTFSVCEHLDSCCKLLLITYNFLAFLSFVFSLVVKVKKMMFGLLNCKFLSYNL